jgi:hypothetical protein
MSPDDNNNKNNPLSPFLPVNDGCTCKSTEKAFNVV